MLQQLMVYKLCEHSQLHKAQTALKECGHLMLLYNLAILDSEDPQLAAVHDNPS